MIGRLLFLLSLALLSACAPGEPRLHAYQIVINGSATPVPVEFTGSYACETKGKERISDISGEGTMSVSFECEKLLQVRVQRVLGEGLVSMTVYKNGVVVYSAAPTDSVVASIYVPVYD